MVYVWRMYGIPVVGGPGCTVCSWLFSYAAQYRRWHTVVGSNVSEMLLYSGKRDEHSVTSFL